MSDWYSLWLEAGHGAASEAHCSLRMSPKWKLKLLALLGVGNDNPPSSAGDSGVAVTTYICHSCTTSGMSLQKHQHVWVENLMERQCTTFTNPTRDPDKMNCMLQGGMSDCWIIIQPFKRMKHNHE